MDVVGFLYEYFQLSQIKTSYQRELHFIFVNKLEAINDGNFLILLVNICNDKLKYCIFALMSD